MNDNTALVLIVALTFIWNITLWAGFFYLILAFDLSWWLILVPVFFTVFPKSRDTKNG